MQRKRLVYSSLDCNRDQQYKQSKPKTRNRKRKHVKSIIKDQLTTAAKVYLQQLKYVPKYQIQHLLKSARLPQKQHEQTITKKQRYKQEGQSFQQTTNQPKLQRVRTSNKKKSTKHFNRLQFKMYKNRYGIKQSSFIKSSYKIASNQRRSQTRDLKSRQQKTRLFQMAQNNKMQVIRYQPPNLSQFNQSTDIQKAYMSHRKLKKQTKLLQYVSSNNNNNSSLSPKKDLTTQIKSNDSIKSFKTLQSNQRLMMRSIKGFIINQRNQMISKFLMDQGWKKFSDISQRYTLKWTYNDSIKDYQILRTAEKQNKQMYFNHINNNKLVKKDDFNSIVKCLQAKGFDTASFIPETYIIGAQRAQFIQKFQFRTIFACLHKHYTYFKLKQQNQQSNSNCKNPSCVQDICQYLANLTDEQAENTIINNNQVQQFVINIPLLYNLLVICCSIWINGNPQFADVATFNKKFNDLSNDKSIIQSFNAINRADLQFQQYQKIRYSSSSSKRKQIANSNQKSKAKQVSIINGYLKMVKNFMTPCRIFIEATTLLYEYFASNFKKNVCGGLRNVWIIKPCTGSKGSGIQVVDKVDRINQISQSGSARIVQKYIENVWTLKAEDLNKLDAKTVSQYKSFVNKKFDIRQWVLLTSFGCYIFSSFYIRVCSQQYNFSSLTNQYSHLSNFSINRQNYSNPQQSVMSEQQFVYLLQKLGKFPQFKNTRKKINESIRLLVQEALEKCEKIPGTFEVLGFDIIIDQQLNPWVIQCNMSPACNLRTEWLRQMKMCMMIGTLKIMFDYNTLSPQAFQQNYQYNWIQLSKNTERKRKKAQQKLRDISKSKQYQLKICNHQIKLD